MKDVIEKILQWVDFPVLISTVVGGVILWILSESSKKGKLRTFITQRKVIGSFRDQNGDFKEITDLSDPRITSVYIWLAIDAYNAASYVKIARNIAFKITYKDRKNESLPVYRGGNEISSLNFEPKKLELLHLNTTIPNEKFSNIKRLELTYINEVNKLRVLRINL